MIFGPLSHQQQQQPAGGGGGGRFRGKIFKIVGHTALEDEISDFQQQLNGI